MEDTSYNNIIFLKKLISTDNNLIRLIKNANTNIIRHVNLVGLIHFLRNKNFKRYKKSKFDIEFKKI